MITQDEIIEMANKAYAVDDGKPLHPSALFHLEIFAKLVANKICEELATEAERNGNGILAMQLRGRNET